MVCVKVDAEKRKDIASRFAVRAYPTIAFIQPDGTLVDAVRGYRPPEGFAPLLDQYLASDAQTFVLTERLKDHPELLDVRYDLARLYMRLGRADLALEQLEILSKNEDRLGEEQRWGLRLDRGRALLAAGKPKDAAKDLESYAKKRKGSARYREAVYFLAESKLALGDRKGALKWYQRLLESKSDGWLAEQSRARVEEIG